MAADDFSSRLDRHLYRIARSHTGQTEPEVGFHPCYGWFGLGKQGLLVFAGVPLIRILLVGQS